MRSLKQNVFCQGQSGIFCFSPQLFAFGKSWGGMKHFPTLPHAKNTATMYSVS